MEFTCQFAYGCVPGSSVKSRCVRKQDSGFADVLPNEVAEFDAIDSDVAFDWFQNLRSRLQVDWRGIVRTSW